jgi:hypothetical protein
VTALRAGTLIPRSFDGRSSSCSNHVPAPVSSWRNIFGFIFVFKSRSCSCEQLWFWKWRGALQIFRQLARFNRARWKQRKPVPVDDFKTGW